MAIEDDDCELPIAIADSQTELARILGIDRQTISRTIKWCEQENAWCPFLKIPEEGNYELPPTTRKRRHITRKVRMNNTVFDSVTDAAAALNKDRTTITYYIKKGHDPHGNKWNYYCE